MKADPVQPTLGEALLAMAAKRGQTQREAAAEIGASLGSFNKWTNDQVVPGPRFFEPLQTYLAVELGDGLGGMIARSWERREAAAERQRRHRGGG